ncbi:MAG: OmpP1/FadL family transporter [Bacteroidota bacterium]
MKKLIFTLGTGVICTISALAQNDIDAMRYSQITFGGTARFASMAGSMGALGGDISTLSFNPAGIAIYRKTELSITPSIFSQTTSSAFNGMTASDRKLNFNLGNIGLVTTINLTGKNNTTGWESVNFGFGYNRKNNFHNRIRIEGYNTSSSLLDTYVNEANGYSSESFDQFSTHLAWVTYLLNPDTGAALQYNHVIKNDSANYGQYHRKSIESRGSMGETVISFGGNYKSKVYIGATLGIVNAKYLEESVYEEVDAKDTIQAFKSFTYAQDLSTKGNGFNFKIGMIYKPVDWLRIGAAVHTPTILQLKDQYSSTMKSDLESITYDTVSPQGSFDYTITTPFKAIGSLGFIVNKMALFNIDYEYVDYSYAQLNSSPNVFSEVNNTIHSKYTSTSNIRIGAEVRFDPLTFRAGYALYGSPFKNGENINANRNSYTAGIGFRENNYFIDFAYVLTKYTQYNYLYDPAIVDRVKSDYSNSSFMLTLGLRF